MKLYKIPLSLATVLLLAASFAGAADLTDYQKLALENRPLVERYIVNLQAREVDQSLARSGYMPSVDLGYTVNVLDNDSFTEDRENSVAYAALTLNEIVNKINAIANITRRTGTPGETDAGCLYAISIICLR